MALEAEIDPDFRAMVERNVQEASQRAAEPMDVESWQMPEICPVMGCDFHPASQHGLSIHLARTHFKLPRAVRRAMAGHGEMPPSLAEQDGASEGSYVEIPIAPELIANPDLGFKLVITFKVEPLGDSN